MYWRLGKAIGIAAAKGILALVVGSTTQVGAALLASSTLLEHKPISSLFKKAKNNAKVAGKLLACALALRMPFKTQTVSLVGFSLGSQVIKSCLKTLDVIYEESNGPPRTKVPCDLIQDVVMLGGAAHFDKNKDKYRRLFANIVNGEAKTVYSAGDTVLLLYMASEACWKPLGRNRLKINNEEDEESKEDERYLDRNIRFGKDLVYSMDATTAIVTKAINGSLSHSDYMDPAIQEEMFDRIEFK